MEMEEAARQFCAVIESAGETDRARFVVALVPALASVIAAAAAISPVDLDDAVADTDSPSIDDQEWSARLAAVRDVLEDWNDYWGVDPPVSSVYADPQPDVWAPALSDDLADVWRDLEQGLRGLASGAPSESVHWEWRFSFYAHWGTHATRALAALHPRLFSIVSASPAD